MTAVGCGTGASPESSLATQQQALEEGPDFVVSAVTGPTSAPLGQSISASVTVCNQGTQSDSTWVEVFLSTDTVISPPVPPAPPTDLLLGGSHTDYLVPGQCQTLSISGTSWGISQGAYYLGAVADPQNSRFERIENNNSLAGSRIGIGNGADFVVSAVNGPSSAQPGQTLTTSVTVCNQGTQSDSTRVEAFLSTDAIISPPWPPGAPGSSTDLLVGSAHTDSLMPGQCQTLSLRGSLWNLPQGVFYLGAVVDPYGDRTELIEDNNSLAGSRIGIGNGADFVVSAVTGPKSAQLGQTLTTSVTVCNQGTQSDSTRVEAFLSTDAIISPPVPPSPSADIPIGDAHTDDLHPGQCQTLSIMGSPWNLPSSGVYYLGAVADPHNERLELIDDNNSLAGSRIGIGNGADFVVSAVTGPKSAQRNQPFTTSVTVCNQGTQSDSTRVETFLSTDALISPPVPPGPPTDIPLGSAYTDYLFPGQCQTLSIPSSSWGPPQGAYYLGAVVDPQNDRTELIEDNNSLAGSRIGIGEGADFVVTAVTGPASTQQGQPITTSVTVCNQGTQSNSTWVEVFLSADTVIAPPVPPMFSTDFPFGGAPTDPLFPGQCQTLSIPSPSWGGPSQGAYYLGAVVDPQNDRTELIEDNNSLAGSRIGIGNGADFVVTAVTGPKSTQQGQPITTSVTVCNQGTQSDSTWVEVFLSADTVITPAQPPVITPDFPLGGTSTDFLAPGQCQTLSIPSSSWGPPQGAYYLGAVVDPQNDRTELIEDNNSLAGSRIGIGNGADFIVTAVTGPKSTQQGQPITTSVTVCNQGTQSDSTWVEVFLSADTVITPAQPPVVTPDFPLGGTSTDFLAPGQCQTLSVSGPAWSPTPGAYYLGAVVDPQNDWPELIKDNNTLVGSRIGIGSRADFLVTAITGPKSAQEGQSITTSVTVCNQGTQGDSTQVEVVLSADTLISASPPYAPSADFPLGSASTNFLAPGQCQTLSVSGAAWSPSPGVAPYLGAVVDPEDDRLELIEDNNTLAGSRIGIGSRPDFVVSTVTGPASASQSKSITASVTVCNQGTQRNSTQVDVFLSSDKIITPPSPATSPMLRDHFVGGVNTATLGPGQCQTLSVQGPVSVPSVGAYYWGAVADPQNYQPELMEDNNAKAGSRISITP
ncbi:CARDB domain-containing protein [Stigmatella erecta]|uniref:CARDB protein n=1 Tax=Stigmatella erecta TaxID=83460 RepID=A0A1I0K2J6_9BACT|nr:CARDB domain-containing protein [Stigmatella erecta]SEU17964.1 CARDB protein [Stigmatella erecta]